MCSGMNQQVVNISQPFLLLLFSIHFGYLTGVIPSDSEL